MSTRANIEIFSKEAGQKITPGKGIVMLYRHYDGYPRVPKDTLNGVFPDFEGFLNARYPNGVNWQMAGYVATQMIVYFYDFQRNKPTLEITDNFHGDIEYYYQVIFCKGMVELRCYEKMGSDCDGTFKADGRLVEKKQYKSKKDPFAYTAPQKEPEVTTDEEPLEDEEIQAMASQAMAHAGGL
ncbi:MAG TPA: hypothetical protein VN455_05635 [Methanotrichaceae archaeon]|nr:hypothetical protein [Methanotrichaceae archaeon]